MSNAIIFEPANTILEETVTKQLLRIPEVSLQIKEFQKTLDNYKVFKNLTKTNSIDEKIFCNLLTIAIQSGLYSRYQSQFGKPLCLIGSNPLLMQLVRKCISIKELISIEIELLTTQKQHFSSSKESPAMNYSAYQNINGFFYPMKEKTKKLTNLLQLLKERFEIISFSDLLTALTFGDPLPNSPNKTPHTEKTFPNHLLN